MPALHLRWCDLARSGITFHGRFVKLVPDERVVEVVELETTDPPRPS